MSTLDELKINSFLQRLKSLQRLCSYSDPNFPVSLLFVAGQDGRNNKGSISVIKYLFFGAVGKELLDGTLDLEFEVLEDLVLLIQQSSVSIVWTHEMKRKIGPIINYCPMLIEYLSSPDEEDVMDLLQARKCCDFKRMIIESTPANGGIGVPVPLGYDDILDVESWPMLQAFALDEVYGPTGFITARYSVIDITEYLDILFRTVDGPCVSAGVDVLAKNVLPHTMQLLRMLDAETGEQRASNVADDVIGPLAMLFEFGELERGAALDPAMRPVLLFGGDSEFLGDSSVKARASWQSTKAENSLHVVVEGCEPASGIRWCRTYFLQRGKCVDFIYDAEELVATDGVKESWSATGERTADGATAAFAIVRRLEQLYATLWLGLRSAVRKAFAQHNDVLEAGTAVQAALDALLRGDSLQLDIANECSWPIGVRLLPGERLQVHMDCMNSLGQIVSIEDVDDMGGGCWTYIRVSVHGVSLPDHKVGSVAVGDTFLFSVATSANLLFSSAVLGHLPVESQSSLPTRKHLPLLGDGFCLTHPIPYFFALPGAGVEDKSGHRLLNCVRSPHLASAIGLGRAMDDVGTGLVSLPMLTDHPYQPMVFSQLRPYSGGFVVEKMQGSCLPMLVTMETHVEAMWTVNLADALKQALAQYPGRLAFAPSIDFEEGVLVVFKMKSHSQLFPVEGDSEPQTSQVNSEFESSHDDDEESSWSPKASEGSRRGRQPDLKATIQYNPLKRCLPEVPDEPRYVGFILPADSRASNALSAARLEWRTAARMNDVPEIRGFSVKEGVPRFPVSILNSYLVAIDLLRYGLKSAVELSDPFRSSRTAQAEEADFSCRQVLTLAVAAVHEEFSSTTIDSGYNTLRCVHSVSESRRLHREATVSVESAVASDPRRLLLPVLVMAGSGGFAMAGQLFSRLVASLTSVQKLRFFVLDLAEISRESVVDGTDHLSMIESANLFTKEIQLRCKRFINAFPSSGNTADVEVIVTVVVLSTVHRIGHHDLIGLLEQALGGKNTSTISVISPSSMTDRQSRRVDDSVGKEILRSETLEMLQAGASDVVAVIDAVGSEFSAVRRWVESNHGQESTPATVVLKLTPTILRIDDETFELITDSIERHQASNKADNYRATPGLRFGIPFSKLVDAPVSVRTSCGLAGRGAAVVCKFAPTESVKGVRAWHLSNLVSCLQLLFPNASCNQNTSNADSWNVPPLSVSAEGSNNAWMKRMLLLCKTKVMASKQAHQAKSLFQKRVADILSGSAKRLQSLRRNLCSLHGVLRVKNTGLELDVESPSKRRAAVDSTELWISVEASCDVIVVRQVLGAKLGHFLEHNGFADPVGVLFGQGSMNLDEMNMLEELVGYCGAHRLQALPLLTPEDISLQQRMALQKGLSSSFPLLGGWGFDGARYVSVVGTVHALRPDIDILVDFDVARRNRKIEEYNNLLAEVSSYL